MTKISTLLFSLLFCIFLSNAQSREELSQNLVNDSKTTLSISIGPSIPIGEFGTIDVNEEKAGLAKTGIQLIGSLNYLITESFYISLQGGFSSNGFDEDELLIPVRASVPNFVNVTVSSNNWNARTLNIGAGTRTAIDSRTFFLTKFGIGLQSLSSPKYDITLTDGTTTQVVSQRSEWANNVNLNLGAIIETELNPTKTTFLRIGIDYFRAVQDFEQVEINSTINGLNNAPPEFFDFTQSFETINITIGLSFKI